MIRMELIDSFLERYQATVAQDPGCPTKRPPSSSADDICKSPDVLRAYLESCGLKVKRVKSGPEGNTILVLDSCPMDPAHGQGTDTAIVLRSDGIIGFVCKHDSCASFSWRDVRKKIDPEYQGKDVQVAGEERRRIKSQATELVEIARDADLFHSPQGDAWATVPVGDHRETYQVKAKGFRHWLANAYYRLHGKAACSQATQDALGLISAQAVFDGPERTIHVRLAECGGHIYIDLADPERRVIRVGPDGWEVVQDSPVRFWHPRGMLPLPEPVRGGRIESLFKFVNVSNRRDRALILAWLLSTFQPNGPYPLLALHGLQGSGKSTASRVLRALIDPNTIPLRSKPRTEHDLMIMAVNARIVVFDNLSGLPVPLSDALCRLATGGGFATRELYTDADEVLFEATRPVIVNGIEDLATRPDLLNRTITITLDQIADEARVDERTFWEKFEGGRAALLGCLLDSVAEALRNLPATKLATMPRMADFARWATAGEQALGLRPGEFLDAYAGNLDEANALALEASTVAMAIHEFIVERGDWAGTVKDLLEVLNGRGPDQVSRTEAWRRTPRALSGALRRVAPSLRGVGVEATFKGRCSRGSLIHLKKLESPCIQPSQHTRSSHVPEHHEGEPPGEDGRNDDHALGHSAPTPEPSPQKRDSEAVKPPADGSDGSDGQMRAYSSPYPEEAGEHLEEDDPLEETLD